MMRGRGKMLAMRLVLRPARAPTEMKTLAHVAPTAPKAPARGASLLSTLREGKGVAVCGVGGAGYACGWDTHA